MEDRERPPMHICGESKTTRIMTAIVRYVTSGSGLRFLRPFDFCWTEGTKIHRICKDFL